MAKKIVGGLVVTLLAVSFGASYGWTCHGSTECQPSSLLAIDTSLQSDVQLVQIIAGPTASSSTGSNGGPPTLIAGVNIVGKPGSTLDEVLSEADSMQSSMKTITGSTLTNTYGGMLFVHSSTAEIVTVGGNTVVYVYITIWLFSGTVPADATAQSLLLDAYTGLAGWSKGTPASVQLGSTTTAATSASAQSGGDTTTAPLSTTMASSVFAGDTELPVDSTVGFNVGAIVVVEGGGNMETGVIASIGSADRRLDRRLDAQLLEGGAFVLTAGLTHSYPADSTVTLDTTTAGDVSDIASGVGDPHLSNTQGEHFDIYQPGNITLLQLPRGEAYEPMLRVEADARRMGDVCSVYFQVVTISGTSTNQSEPLRFLVSPPRAPRGMMWKQWKRFGMVDLKVTHREKGIEYLNVYAKNLARIGYPVGGLLGIDDHTAVAKRPRQCAHRHATALFSVAEAK